MTIDLLVRVNKIHDSDDIIGIKEQIAAAVGEDCAFVEVREPYNEQLTFHSREIGGGRPVSQIIKELEGMTIGELRAVTDAIIQLSKTAPN